MLYGLLVTLFILLCFMLIAIILLQKSKSSMGLGGLGGGTQMLFGGSGGQDLFQKATWVMVALFMLGSLTLTLMKSSSRYNLSRTHTTSMPHNSVSQNMPAQQLPEIANPANAFAQPEPSDMSSAQNTPEQVADTQTA